MNFHVSVCFMSKLCSVPRTDPKHDVDVEPVEQEALRFYVLRKLCAGIQSPRLDSSDR